MRWQNLLPLISSVYIIGLFTLTSGIFNGILEGNNNLFITRQKNLQTLGEVILGVFIFTAGATAFYIIHKAGERKVGVNRLIIGGFCIIALVMISLYALVAIKA